MPDVKNILEGLSKFFLGVQGTDVLPADTLAFGGTWPGTWRDVGYTTEDGVTLTLNATFTPVPTAQSRTPVTHLSGTTDDRIGCTLYEATLTNLRAVTGRGTITTTPPNGGPGFEQLELTANPAVRYVAVGFEGVAPPNDKSNPRRIILPSALATASVTYNQRIGQAVGIACEFSALGGTGNNIKIRDVLTL